MNPQVTDDRPVPGNAASRLHAQLHVYENDTYLGKRFFDDGRLSIGSSRRADILLNHSSVQRIHAVVLRDGERIILKNNYPEDGLRVNGLSVESVPLKSRDLIKIGPFDLVIEIDGDPSGSPGTPVIDPEPAVTTPGDPAADRRVSDESAGGTTCALMLIDQYPSSEARYEAAGRLSAILKKDLNTCLNLLSRTRVVIKKGLDPALAGQWRKKLRDADIFCRVKKERLPATPDRQIPGDPAPQAAAVQLPDPLTAPPHADAPQPAAAAGNLTAALPLFNFSIEEEVDAEEDADDLWQAPFSLKDKLAEKALAAPVSGDAPRYLAVTKTIGQTVADVVHLAAGKRYDVSFGKKSLPLVCFTAKGEGQVFFTRSMGGYIRNADQTTTDLDHYKQDAYLKDRRRERYCLTVPGDARAVIIDGNATYHVQRVHIPPWRDVKESPRPKSMNWRHWATSAGFHLAVYLIAGMAFLFQSTAPVKEKPRFVKIDPALIKQLETRTIETPKPRKTPPPPKPEPQPVAAKATPPREKIPPQPVRQTAAAQKKTGKTTRAAAPSKHPQAGGGFGKGNIKNRDVNQTGLLSLLGNSKVESTGNAIASITNLDAVASPGASEKNYTVGGIKGSLGTGTIAVSNDTIVMTRGSSQVLRSAGASGPGRVAALKKGTTGKKQVQALVTASMTRTVKIQGGMSREAVKRVIDQHLDQITMCYETALLTNPSISGRVVFEWKILMTGKVGETRIVASNINSHEIHACIKSAIKSWQFPKPTGAEVVVSYPFVFDLVAF